MSHNIWENTAVSGLLPIAQTISNGRDNITVILFNWDDTVHQKCSERRGSGNEEGM